MDENKKSIDGIIEKLALITDSTQSLFPEGKSALIFELNYYEFKNVQRNFKQVDQYHTQFKLDISGVEVIFILEGSSQVTPQIIPQVEEPKLSFWKRLFSGKSRKLPVKN
jgi:hypothetical protein